MKMVRSLLLGSAAGLVAMAGAQAADLPVKAKPVEYVKICSLYGVGFYYIPGTDTCIKIGGYVRADYYWDAPGAFPKGAGPGLAPALPASIVDANLRPQQNLDWRARAVITGDIRSQTSYGVLRAYFSGGWNNNNGVTGVQFDRAFIQFAGFTFGLAAVSFFDGFSPCGGMSNIVSWSCNGQGATGWLVFGYTASLGNGVSLNLALEYPRNGGVFEVGSVVAGPVGLLDTAGNQVPDLVASLRVDQAWGFVMVAAALHRVAGNYYGEPDVVTAGGPGDEWGWAVQGSLFLNVPGIPGDQFGIGLYYGRGAIQYVQTGAYTGFAYIPNNLNLSYGFSVDGVFDVPGALAGYAGDIQLTTSWAILLGYQHKWNNEWMTSLFGGYSVIDYNATATALICAFSAGSASAAIVYAAGPGACNPDQSMWSIGSRTVWSPVPNLSFALDVVYHHLDTSNSGGTAAVTAGTLARPGGAYLYTDHNFWAAMFRVQRSFYP